MRDVSQAVILTKLALKIVNFTKINAKMSECWGLRHSYFQNGPQAHFKVLFTRLVWIRMHFSKGNCDLFISSIGEKNLCLTAFSKLFYFFFFFFCDRNGRNCFSPSPSLPTRSKQFSPTNRNALRNFHHCSGRY